MFEKILVPVDGSLQSQAALEPAKYLAKLGGAAIVLVRAAGVPKESPLSAAPAEAYVSERTRCERYLRRVADSLFRSGLKAVTWEAVDAYDDATNNLLWAIQQFDADLVIMTSHSRQGVKRVFQGSVAEQLIRQAPCPVLVVGKKSKSFQNFIHRPLAL